MKTEPVVVVYVCWGGVLGPTPSLKEHSSIVERIYAHFKDIVIKEMNTPFYRFYSHGT